ncbi:MAG: DUF6655 family protein, partial [Planctomycetota bacterium]
MLLLLGVFVGLSQGCATLRVTNSGRTADEQFLQTEAIREAVRKLSLAALRERTVWVDPTYIYDSNFASAEQSFMLGELRNKLLIEGAKLAERREDASIIVEPRAGAIGVNRSEFLLGIPGSNVPVGEVDVDDNNIPVVLPEVAIVKNRKQRGFAAVTVTAYYRDTGEFAATSGPFVGRTIRTDVWFFGLGPRTSGDIP